jgi:hypothetical protein
VRVRVRFRYNTETGEVEVFQVDDLAESPPTADHDARHDAATLRIARVVDPHARVTEVLGDPVLPISVPETPIDEPGRREERRLRD